MPYIGGGDSRMWWPPWRIWESFPPWLQGRDPFPDPGQGPMGSHRHAYPWRQAPGITRSGFFWSVQGYIDSEAADNATPNPERDALLIRVGERWNDKIIANGDGTITVLFY